MQEAFSLSQQNTPLIMVCKDEKKAFRLYEQVKFLNPDARYFPAWDTQPYDRISPSSHRLALLCELLELDIPIIVTSVAGFMLKTPPRDALKNQLISLRVGERYERNLFLNQLIQWGYRQAGTVYETGEFCIRGSIIDLFPIGEALPVRLDFFDADLESIKRFEPISQRTHPHVVQAVSVFPVCEVLLSKKTIECFQDNYLGKRTDDFYQRISQGQSFPGMEQWMSLFYDNLETLKDYCSASCAIWKDPQVDETVKARLSFIEELYHMRYQQDHYYPVLAETLYLPEIQGKILPSFSCKPLPSLLPFRQSENLIEQVNTIRKMRATCVFVAHSSGSQERFLRIFQDIQIAKTWPQTSGTFLIVAPFENGFLSDTHCVLTEDDIWGKKYQRPHRKKRTFTDLQTFHTDELIVHSDHGIGRYLGLETISVNQCAHDCLVLVYSGGDKLYLPVENINLVSRYGAGQAALDKLGATAWQMRKAKAKKKILETATHLMKIAATRTLKQAPIFHIPDTYDRFVSQFPFEETEDQERAIAETLEDLTGGTCTDRLICGDVGFGKTEVAMRAAFLAVSNGYKVAILTPTTLLCRQHALTFEQRFSDTSFTILPLSRLHPSVKPEAIYNASIVIGTHTLFTKKTCFKNLGLVIVDEEQHFGVKQKEHLKDLKDSVHVLTLTATPIPRTLQLALTGVRDLSLITTPPIDRLAIQSRVTPYDDVMIKEAILQEIRRQGQIFYVTPRIEFLNDLEEKLRSLIPEARIAVAHGKIKDLDKIMNDFYDHRYDILLATHIIESGIDIASANTLIVDHADLFGLSQLYQLRGRVGRSKHQAYAYFIPSNSPTEEGQKRLHIMQSLDQLGAGFNLASHDLDTRGAGNIVGEEQSGHIQDVGVELYQLLLQESVLMLRAEEEAQVEWTPSINLGIPVLIPHHYVEDLDTRLTLYRRLGNLKTRDELDDFAAECVDRFGPFPEEVHNLFDLMECKQLCRAAFVSKLDVNPKGFVVHFHLLPDPQKIFNVMSELSKLGEFKVRPDHSFVLLCATDDHVTRMKVIRILLKKIINSSAYAKQLH